METHQSFEGAFGVTLRLQTALESLSKANPRGTSSRSAPAPGCSQPSGPPLHPGYSQTPPRDVGGLKPPVAGCEQHPSPPAEGLQFGEDQQPSQPPHKLGASASIRTGHHPLPRCRFLGRAEGARSRLGASCSQQGDFWGESQPAAPGALGMGWLQGNVFKSFFARVAISRMLRPPQSHAAPCSHAKTHSEQLRLLQHPRPQP